MIIAPDFLRSDSHVGHFFPPETEDTAVIDPANNALKLPHSLVSGSNCRIVTMNFGMNLSG